MRDGLPRTLPERAAVPSAHADHPAADHHARRRAVRRPGDRHPRGGPASIEEDLFPLPVLHDILRDVGLARLARGVLSPTRAAADDREVIRRLRTWFDPDGFRSRLGVLTVAVLAASDPLPKAELIRRVEPLMGDGWAIAGRPLVTADYETLLAGMDAELRALDLIGGDWKTWESGPSATTLLPRATRLADLWPRETAW